MDEMVQVHNSNNTNGIMLFPQSIGTTQEDNEDDGSNQDTARQESSSVTSPLGGQSSNQLITQRQFLSEITENEDNLAAVRPDGTESMESVATECQDGSRLLIR